MKFLSRPTNLIQMINFYLLIKIYLSTTALILYVGFIQEIIDKDSLIQFMGYYPYLMMMILFIMIADLIISLCWDMGRWIYKKYKGVDFDASKD